MVGPDCYACPSPFGAPGMRHAVLSVTLYLAVEGVMVSLDALYWAPAWFLRPAGVLPLRWLCAVFTAQLLWLLLVGAPGDLKGNLILSYQVGQM